MAEVKIDRAKAKTLLVQIGLKTAAKMSDAKLLGALESLDEIDEAVDPGKQVKLYNKIVKANQAGKEFVLEGEDVAPPKKATKATKAAAKSTKGKSTKKAAPKAKGTAGGGGKGRDENGHTAKDRVYLVWKKCKGEDATDYEAIQTKAKADTVKVKSIAGWISAWRNERGLPRVATKS